MPVLQFKGKTAVESYHHTVPHHTLEFSKSLSCLPKGEEPSLAGNLIIEGDNLLALKALLPTHAGRVDFVYIDPPYNRGEEKWVYNDNLSQPQFKEWIGQTVGKEGEDACRHEKWCCMMYPRLMLIKELMSESAIIFVSIDDIELGNLRLLMDEIFGEENRFDILAWKNTYGGGSKSTYTVGLHEYILCYGRKKSAVPPFWLPPSPDIRKYYKHRDSHFPTLGPHRTQPLSTKSMDERENLRYPIPYKGKDVWPEKQWLWQKDKTFTALEQDKLVFSEGDDGVTVYYKQYLYDEEGEERGAKPYTIIDGMYTQHGTEAVEKIFGDGKAFPFPKPPSLIKHLLMFACPPGGIVLDAFAGSGTSAHAVLELNAESDANLKFVITQQRHETKEQEKKRINICRTVTAERVRRLIEGYDYTGKEKHVLLEERLSWTALKKADSLVQRINKVRNDAEAEYDAVKVESKEGVVRVIAESHVDAHADGLRGGFSFASVSDKPLLGEYRDLGKTLPSYNDIAKYIFYTETSRNWSSKDADKTTGRIGAHQGTSYYVLYKPNRKTDWPVDMEFLENVAVNDEHNRLVVYCEKIWLHRQDLKHWEEEHGKKVRLMLVPFNLK